ncbi:MAG TPA: hypothetical protein DEG44_04485 [Candidatus Kerfeldbacteria bacterium]|nr:hypothetical protein [Candidatus Kerfeldbacteria bacterium]
MPQKNKRVLLPLLLISLFVAAVLLPTTAQAAGSTTAYNKLRVAKLIVTSYIQNSKGKVTVKDLLKVTKNALFKSNVTVQGNLSVDDTVGVVNIDFADSDITTLDTTTLTGGSIYYNVADTKLYLWTGTAWVDLSAVDTDTNTTYTAGSGLTLTDTVFAATLGTTIESSEITDDTIAAADIATDAITTAELLDSTVASADIAADTIVAADIATSAVTTTEILDDSISAADIASDTILAGDIATDAVTTTEILDGTVATADISADTIAAADIAADAVTTSEILDSTVASADIAADTIVAGDIATSAVATAEILDDTIAAADIANVARYISFPLESFIDCETNAGDNIGYDTDANNLADFVNSSTDGLGFVIRFDDTGSSEDQDSQICNNFTVPADYAAGGRFIIRALKDGHTNASEKIACDASVNGAALGGAGDVTTSTATSTSYTCEPTISSLAANDSVSFTFYILSDTTMNDAVDIASVAFSYSATQ